MAPFLGMLPRGMSLLFVSSGGVWMGPEPPTTCPRLTILFGPGEDLLARTPSPAPGKGQHLDAVVGVAFSSPSSSRRGCCVCDVFNLAQLWRTRKHKHVTMAVGMFLLLPGAGPH